MKSTWRFVMKIVGLSLAVAGIICLIIGYGDKLAEGAVSLKDKLSGKRELSEFEDYDDDLFYED